eukprot:11642243-Ditylum_brightwellii.AAC.1
MAISANATALDAAVNLCCNTAAPAAETDYFVLVKKKCFSVVIVNYCSLARDASFMTKFTACIFFGH